MARPHFLFPGSLLDLFSSKLCGTGRVLVAIRAENKYPDDLPVLSITTKRPTTCFFLFSRRAASHNVAQRRTASHNVAPRRRDDSLYGDRYAALVQVLAFFRLVPKNDHRSFCKHDGDQHERQGQPEHFIKHERELRRQNGHRGTGCHGCFPPQVGLLICHRQIFMSHLY